MIDERGEADYPTGKGVCQMDKKMDKKRRVYIENAFRNYYKNKEKLAELKDKLDASLLPGISYEKVSVMTSPKNYLEEKLVKVFDEADRLCRLIQMVDYVLIKYQGEYKYNLIATLYFNGFSINRAARFLHIGRRTVFRWRDEILDSAENYGVSLKIFKEE